MSRQMQAHEQFHFHMALIRNPLPEGVSNKVMMVELCQRVEMVLSYYVNDEFSTADGVLKLVRSGEEMDRYFVILEHGKIIARFVKYPVGDWKKYFQPGKDEQIIKMLRVIMSRFMRGRRGLHLYQPPYPEPEILEVREVEGRDYPRRFVRQEWLNWLEDSNNKSPLFLNIAMKRVAQKMFPEGREGKTFRTCGITPENGLEFEVFITKNI